MLVKRSPCVGGRVLQVRCHISVCLAADVDECTDGGNNCVTSDNNGYCNNTVGSFRCGCEEGYTGDGRTDGTNCTGNSYPFRCGMKTSSHRSAFRISGHFCRNTPVVFPHKGPGMPKIDVFCLISREMLLNKQSSFRWFETWWSWCDVIVMLAVGHIKCGQRHSFIVSCLLEWSRDPCSSSLLHRHRVDHMTVSWMSLWRQTEYQHHLLSLYEKTNLYLPQTSTNVSALAPLSAATKPSVATSRAPTAVSVMTFITAPLTMAGTVCVSTSPWHTPNAASDLLWLLLMIQEYVFDDQKIFFQNWWWNPMESLDSLKLNFLMPKL